MVPSAPYGAQYSNICDSLFVSDIPQVVTGGVYTELDFNYEYGMQRLVSYDAGTKLFTLRANARFHLRTFVRFYASVVLGADHYLTVTILGGLSHTGNAAYYRTTAGAAGVIDISMTAEYWIEGLQGETFAIGVNVVNTTAPQAYRAHVSMVPY